MLGHASVTTTSIYARLVDRIAENPARYPEELIGLGQTKCAPDQTWSPKSRENEPVELRAENA
jgi:hypothetical protein